MIVFLLVLVVVDREFTVVNKNVEVEILCGVLYFGILGGLNYDSILFKLRRDFNRTEVLHSSSFGRENLS